MKDIREVKLRTDTPGIELILKGLRLVRVYQEREMSWITPKDKENAKTLSNRIEKNINLAIAEKKEQPFTENPKCDPDTNCDW